MRFLLFNVAVALALVYMVAGDNAAGMAKATIDKAKNSAVASSLAVAEVLESALGSENTPPTPKLLDEAPVPIKVVEVEPVADTAPDVGNATPKATNVLARTSLISS